MWKIPLLEARLLKGAGAPQFDTDVAAVFQDAGKKAHPPKGNFGPWIEKLRKLDAFSAQSGATEWLRCVDQSAESLLLVGLGLASDLTEEVLRVAGGNVWSKLSRDSGKTIAIHADLFFEGKGFKSEMSHAKCIRAFAEGLILAAYRFDKYRTKASLPESLEKKGPEKFVFVTQDKSLKSQLDNELKAIHAMAEAVQVTRDWSNEPSNFGTPTFYAQEAAKLAKKHGIKCTILTEKEAAREKMGLFLGVGQGSERENRLVVLEYTPKSKKSSKTIALVGKGITFDSGGISIKPSLRMEEMKHDMTGAATVMGATLLAAAWGVPHKIVTVMAFAENMPNGDAIQPGNIITARNQKTVEIINTDAEGRLILADALDYAQDYKPDAIIDVATLTGAVSIALGKHCCGVLGNDEALIDSLIRAGESNHERMWQLPLFDEYFEDLKSDYADMKNSANDSNGGTIRGAIFLKQFIRKGVSWAHLDIASTAYNVSHYSYMPKKGATGSYVRTLAQMIADY